MQAGKLRKRITFQKPIKGSNPFNTATSGSWATVATLWGSIEGQGSRAVTQANLQSMQVSHVITIRYPGKSIQIGAGYQALYDGRVFSILKGIVNIDERDRTLQIMCWEINPTQGGDSNS